MKEERLFLILGELDDDLVLEADPVNEHAVSKPVSQRNKTRLLRWSLAATALLLTLILWRVWPSFLSKQRYADLPIIHVPSNFVAEGLGMGTIGYKSPEDLPKDELYEGIRGIDTLPVYRLNTQYTQTGDPYTKDIEPMRAKGRELVTQLGYDLGEVKEEILYHNKPNPEKGEAMTPEKEWMVSALVYRGNGWELTVDPEWTIRFFYLGKDPAKQAGELLNTDIRFHSKPSETEWDAAKRFLADRFAAKLGFRNPEFVLRGGDYNFLGKQQYEIVMLEREDALGTFLNDRLNATMFFQAEDQPILTGFRTEKMSRKEVIGEYPLLSENEAKEKLRNGECMTLHTEEFPGEEHLVKTTIVYRKNSEGILLPYYVFLVEAPGEPWPDIRDKTGKNNEGKIGEQKFFEDIHSYAYYYVPAVRPEYLKFVADPEIRVQ